MLNIAVRAARRAGSIINRAALDGGVKVTTKRAKDFVTQVDKAAEAAIIEIARKAYPEHGLLCEESGAAALHEVDAPALVGLRDEHHVQVPRDGRPAVVATVVEEIVFVFAQVHIGQ